MASPDKKLPPEVKILFAVIVFAAFLALFIWGTASVPAGHVGVVTTFGEVNANVLDEGLSFVAPWKSVKRMSLQLQEKKEKMQCPTSQGASVSVEASVLYRLKRDSAAAVYKGVGIEWDTVIVEPQFRSALRETTAKYKAEDLYGSNRAGIEKEVFDLLTQMLKDRGVEIDSVLLRDLELPKTVKAGIENKLVAEQENLKMEFVLKQSEQEAKRKAVDARGIAEAQTIIKKELSHEYLVYLWIQALKEHSGSTIYIPTGADGMPMFKNIEDKAKKQ